MPLTGLIAATPTPFDANGRLNLAALDGLAEHLARHRIDTVFIAGTTGECHSLTVDERLALAQRWSELAKGSNFRLVIHVGANCLDDACTLAAQAQALGASAIAAMAPSYFKPKNVEALTACCKKIADAAPGLPLYYYDIPSFTGVNLSMPDFLELAAERIPTLAGLKFTNPDLMAFQRCLQVRERRFDVTWGLDEFLLAATAVGAKGAVGSTYNLAAPIYQRVLAAFQKNDFAVARAEQYRSVRMIELLARVGFLASVKATLGFLGVNVGPVRLPNLPLTDEQTRRLRTELEQMGFFDWVQS